MAELYRSEAGRAAVLARYRKMLESWPPGSEGRVVPTRQGDTFVMTCGPAGAPPLVLLHGAQGNSAMWKFDAPVWAEHFRVYSVDMIGEPGLSATSRPPLEPAVYAAWLEEALRGLGLERFSLVGESLGGWLALSYAVSRPETVEKLALIVPGGLSSQLRFLYRVLPLLLLGRWGDRKAGELIFGKVPPGLSAAAKDFFEFIALIDENCRPRMELLPVLPDGALRRLTMPVFAIFGGRDVLLDPETARRRLAELLPDVRIDYRAGEPHVIRDRARPILAFLKGAERGKTERI